MKSIEITIPEGLYNYIQKLVDEKYFESIESFVQQASFLLSELHGFGEQTEKCTHFHSPSFPNLENKL